MICAQSSELTGKAKHYLGGAGRESTSGYLTDAKEDPAPARTSADKDATAGINHILHHKSLS